MNKQSINNLLIRAGIVNRNYPAIQYFLASSGCASIGFYPDRYNTRAAQWVKEYLESLGFSNVLFY